MSKPLESGLYEQLVTAGLEDRLATLGEHLTAERTNLHHAEAANRLALHLGRVVERAIEGTPDDQKVAKGIELAQELIRKLEALVAKADVLLDLPVEKDPLLTAILERMPDGSLATIDAPSTPLLDTTLLTNAPGEPRVGFQVLSEIGSANRIDLLMAFVRLSGLRPLRDKLRQHVDSGRPLRVLTTTYTGSTELTALKLLHELGAEVRVSYDTSSTRLHAKAWLFHRASGFSTAFIGSSNLTHSAQVSGLEWNVRVSGARNPDVIEKVSAVFESYWESGDFRPFDAEEFQEQTARGRGDSGPQVYLSPVEIRPLPFQERLLEQIAVSRCRGFHRNLLVSATGTGKTIMAALDYARLRDELPRSRLLFVAHRKEILDQSQATFRHALRRHDFGESWVGGRTPTQFEHVFASVQTLNHADLAHLAADHFDVVIIDEFHHAAANSYKRLLEHLEPKELLGLTATPERADGMPILHWFGDRIAAELRLWDAIDQHYLAPFAYFGIHDGMNLSQVPWKRGTGYDVDGLTNLYTANDSWARFVVDKLREHVDLAGFRALGFCVGVDHARYMARVFRAHGIDAVAVSGQTPRAEREAALAGLAAGRVRVVFSVDLFNEGVDLPDVDTLLLLRPTDSPVLFLQQLGRGLRRSEGKTACTVLDFVGQHRKEFHFDRPLRALLPGTRKELERQVEQGFPFLPAGCHMELDRVASSIVLKSIRNAVPSQWKQRVAELRNLAERHEPRLQSYLEHTGLELDELYRGPRGWSDLCQDAGLAVAPAGPQEDTLRRAVGRLLHLDDARRLNAYKGWATNREAPLVDELSLAEQRLLRMLVASLVDRAIDKTATLQEGVDLVWNHPQVLAELAELVDVLASRVEHLGAELQGRTEVPLQVHARYTRREILAGFGYREQVDGGPAAKIPAWQTGCQWLPDARADLFAFTLDKTGGTFSPTTRYRDYAMSRELIHWQSQSVTRADSDTGLRYINHEQRGSEIMLFARLRQSDPAFWFLGPARYVRHEGERPISIVWRLEHPLPGDLFAAFAAAVA